MYSRNQGYRLVTLVFMAFIAVASGATLLWMAFDDQTPIALQLAIGVTFTLSVVVSLWLFIDSDAHTASQSDELLKLAPDLMKQIQREMYERALARQQSQIHDVATLADLEKELERGTTGFFRIKYDLTLNEEFDGLIEKYKISRRCLDKDDPTFVYVAKSY